jgi:hypothetical protein
MRSFSTADFLTLWERGAGLHAVDRGLMVLNCALPETNYETLVRLPLGRRDRYLLQVRRRNFGDVLEAHTECPECRERLEFSLSCAELLENTPVAKSGGKQIAIDGMRFDLKSPDSAAAAAAATSASVEAAIDNLLALCVSPGDTMSPHATAGALTPSMRSAIAAELAALDPAAEIFLELSCPACAHRWPALFDIESLLWTEIRARARRLLQEVDALARVYHWNEAEIFRLSETRRGLYLEMARS